MHRTPEEMKFEYQDDFSNDTALSEGNEEILFAAIVNVFIVGLLGLIGLAANVLILAVLSLDNLKNSPMSILLFVLAICDMSFLLCSVFYQTLWSECVWLLEESIRENLFRVWTSVYIPVWYLGHVGRHARNWMTVIVAADRHYVVSKPLKAKTLITANSVKLQTATVVSIALVYNIPHWFDYRTVHQDAVEAFSKLTNSNNTAHEDSHSVYELVVGTELIQLTKWMMAERVYYLVYHVLLTLVLVQIGPLLLLAYFNTFLCMHISKSASLRNNLLGEVRGTADGNLTWRRKLPRETLMVVAIVTTYLITETPLAVDQVIHAMQDEKQVSVETADSLFYFRHVANMLDTLNSATNFVLYCLISKKFRQQFKRILKLHPPDQVAVRETRQV